LEVSKNKWSKRPNDKYCKEYRENVKFVQISTDEVYGSLGLEGMFNENSSIKPNSPYSASKASADMFVRAYIKTYGFPANITRCSNNYGPNQFPEKLIPLVINNCLGNKDLPVYGDGKQVRDWLHVYDHCEAIDCVIQKGSLGEVYNIGGNNEVENINIIKLIIKYLNKSDDLIKYVKDRPGHDKRYAIDNTKITNELGWKPMYSFKEGLEETIDWYLENKEWINNIVSGEYTNYYNLMYK
jgi:dTDP-glucose 4,6-dehydratase